MQFKFIDCTLLFFLFLSVASYSQQQNAIEKYLQQKQEEYQLPGLAVGIVKNGQVYFQTGYGVTNIHFPKQVTEYSVFHTGSVSKLFTAQAILKLVEAKKIGLDTQLAALDLGLRLKDKQISEVTIRQLLEHQSGLPDVWGYNWRRQDTDSLALQHYFSKKKLKLKTSPGEEYRYSNLGYDLLALIVQQVEEESFETFVKREVLKPANMSTADFRYFAISEDMRVSPHTKNLFGKVKVRKIYPYTRKHAGSSTLNSNVDELCKWMIQFMNDPFHQQFLVPSPVYAYNSLGFQLYRVGGKDGFGHYGGDKGFRSFLMMVPSEETGIVLLSNADFNEDFRQDIGFTLMKSLLNH